MERKIPALSRTALKCIALVSMVIDHIAVIFLSATGGGRLFSFGDESALYVLFRVIGRISFPVFCFVLVQGFLSTRNVKRYLLRLGLFALLSEIPYDLAFNGVLFYWKDQNVMFTLFLSLAVLAGVRKVFLRFPENVFFPFVLLLAGCVAAFVLRCDYTFFGVMLVFTFYYLREQTGLMFVIAAIVLLMQEEQNWLGVVGLPVCLLYEGLSFGGNHRMSDIFAGKAYKNAEQQTFPTAGQAGSTNFYRRQRRSRQNSRKSSYFFYVFYPAHLLVLWGIAQLIR